MKKILIVEDESLISKYLERLLIEYGYHVLGKVYKGSDAISFVEGNIPDLILMDIVLQGDIDGIEVAMQIRNKWNIPIVFISAYNDEDTLKRSSKTEPFGFINKPVNPHVLKLVVEATLKRHELEMNLMNEIEERKKIEEKLRLSEETARVLLNSHLDSIVLLDPQGTILDYNQTLLARLHIYQERIMGSCIFELLPAGMAAELEKTMREALQSGEIKKLYDERDGEWNETYFYPIFNMYGDVTKVVIYMRDVTEEKKNEKEVINAIEKERRVIGQNLHDELGQQLTGLNYLCQAIKKSMAQHTCSSSNDMDEIITIISDLINKTRTLSKGLNPINLEEYGLFTALRELALDTELIFKIPCLFESDQVQITDMSVQLNLYYIARESVNNAIKHGQADHIWISLENEGSVYSLIIENTGKKPENKQQKGIGLEIMKYRAGIIGAKFDAYKTDQGFKVEVKISPYHFSETTHDGLS